MTQILRILADHLTEKLLKTSAEIRVICVKRSWIYMRD